MFYPASASKIFIRLEARYVIESEDGIFFRQTPLVFESRVLMFAQASNVIDTDLYCALLCTVASGNTSWLPNLSLRSVSATDS